MRVTGAVPKRKLIEVALPLEAINRESAREKSIRHGHPSTLHLWWARRPLAAARAVLFAQLVDDPSAHPDRFPTEEDQRIERERLHGIIERLVVWENIRDEKLLAEAHAEILASTDGNPPPILDPFAGGGTIPLEAQRLGLEAHASDLNPVAVLINKALIEIPPKFRDRPPVFPGLAESEIRSWKGAEGLAADVRAYGQWMRDRAEERIGHLYPKATLPDGSQATVIAWIWARTVTCPNPACNAEVPLVSSLAVSTKPGRERWLRPIVSDRRVDFVVADGTPTATTNKQGQGARFSCWVCSSAIAPDYVHSSLDVAFERRPPARLLAIVTSESRRRSYQSPDELQVSAATSAHLSANQIRNEDPFLGQPSRGTFGGNAQGRRYGFNAFADYFTDRQLVALTTLSDLLGEIRYEIERAGLKAGNILGGSLDEGGLGAAAYADAVATYLGMAVSRTTDLVNSVVTWSSSRDQARNLFARQAIPMAWDFVESSPFASAAGDVAVATGTMEKAIAGLGFGQVGTVDQADAAALGFQGVVVSTDPPYYDNIVYSDLSDFFYVWLRRSLVSIHPHLFRTLLVPKSEELVANAYRHDGPAGAKQFFERGFQEVFANARVCAHEHVPITVYYAFKQSESDEVSTGWETLLDGMIRGGWAITSTWPMRSERGGRMISVGTNALASSIVLSLRPRPDTAPGTDRRGFIAALQNELPGALRTLQLGAIAPVDLPQAAIGPGMAVFSRYSSVLEADGSQMSVRSALARINEILDQVLNEQEGDFDGSTRFALTWYRQYGYGIGTFGDADNIARARNTVVNTLDRDGVLTSRANKVQLVKPADTPLDYDVLNDPHTSVWEAAHHLIRILESEGIGAAGRFLAAALRRQEGAVDPDLVKELAFLLYSIAEKNGWTKDALSFNTLATSWPDIVDASRSVGVNADDQAAFEFEGN